MENKLEQLLNSLVKAGWKPRGKNYGVIDFLGTLVFVDLNDGRLSGKNALDLRKLVSKESGLWQFVCENGMIKEERKHERILDPTFGEGWADCKRQEHDGNYGYRLIESALKNESELEDFLLSSIKLD